MSALLHVQPPPFDLEAWRRFGREYRVEFEFCAILQTDYYAARDSYFCAQLEAQVEGRALVRSFGSLLDGVTNAMRRIAVSTGKLFRRPLNHFLEEKADERGLNSYQRIFTSYRLIGELLPRSPLAETTDGFWDELHYVIEIRNRIVHPRCARDLEVTHEEARRVAKMGNNLCAHGNQFAQWLLQKEQKLVWEHLAERRQLYPKIGRNDRCPCGSGKKYKDCCILAAWAA